MAASKFLPNDFDRTATVLLIAGKGVYPARTLSKLRQNGINVSLVAFEGETDGSLFDSFRDDERICINVGQIGKLLKAVKRFGAKYGIMAGQITPKKLFKGMTPDLKAVMMLASLKEKNAETIFGAIANELSIAGCALMDGRVFLDEELAPKGFFCGRQWDIKTHDLEHGLMIARECARLHIGQACVVARGSVVAVEAFEGTDKMIERAGEFEAKEALFVKTVKPRQDYRFDVPVIGERTIRKLAQANIHNVALESEKVIILEPEKVRKLADEFGIKIYGV